MRRIVTKAIGVVLLLYGVVFAVMLVVGLSHSLWLHGKLPPDTLPATASQAEDVAFSVASNAGCGNFDNDLPEESADSWRFECTIGNVPIEIQVYGGDQARSQGLAELQKEDRPYVAKAYYAVTTVVTEAAGQVFTAATPPPASVLDPFR